MRSDSSLAWAGVQEAFSLNKASISSSPSFFRPAGPAEKPRRPKKQKNAIGQNARAYLLVSKHSRVKLVLSVRFSTNLNGAPTLQRHAFPRRRKSRKKQCELW